MDNYNVIGDVAGNFLTLKALLAKMPQDAELICLGDPSDRGARSKEVIEFLITTGKTVNSNHAHIFVDFYEQSKNPNTYFPYYEKEVFFYNGGTQTVESYNPEWHPSDKKFHEIIPESHIEFLKNCPFYIKSKNFVMTHAPLSDQCTLKSACDLGEGFFRGGDVISERSLLWNRYVPEHPHSDLKGKINIFGHNASNMVKVYTTQYPLGIKADNNKLQQLLLTNDEYPIYAICLDTSSAKVLTGLHLPTMTIYQQDYID